MMTENAGLKDAGRPAVSSRAGGGTHSVSDLGSLNGSAGGVGPAGSPLGLCLRGLRRLLGMAG